MPDRREVVALSAPTADPAMRAILEELRDAVGLASSLVSVTLVSEETGIAKTGGSGGTSIEASRAQLDFEDARVDEVRVVVNGKTTTAGHTVRVVDVTGGGSTVLCTVTLPTTTQGYAAGAWTLIDRIGSGTRSLVLQAVGNGSATQTVYYAALQGRTRRLIRK